MNLFSEAFSYILDGANWAGPTGIGARLLEHMWYSLLAVVLSAAVAIPIGLIIGHLRRGEAVVVGLVNALRSLPTLGVLVFLVLVIG
ncbi:MAG: ABC transporter permease, partial [Actinobacteria bacterium]|nr:ABC transporter permease [Actinomycetota bacterium]